MGEAMRVHTLKTTLILALASTLAACAALTDPDPIETEMAVAAPVDDPIVLLIGLDGLRFDAIDRHPAPNLQALAARGTRPQRMIPVMPSKTFVNFYSIATGLYPEDHGMITNAPYDRVYDEVFSNRGGGPQDPRWWAGEPIWTTAEAQGRRAHVMFWLGSEVEGRRPTVWHPYQHDKPYEERVAEVLAWFDAPQDEQPDFAAVYFDHVDSITHRAGPFTEAEGQAVARVDALVGDLVNGLTERGLLERTTIIVVSDHGMAPVNNSDRVIFIDDYAELEGLYMPEVQGRYGAGLNPYIFGYGDAETVSRVHAAMQGAHPELEVFTRDTMPDHFHFDHETRGPDMIFLPSPRWSVTLREADLASPYQANLRGNHGYDNMEMDMGATFIGAGPIFPQGARPDAFENVNVYGLMACALGLDPADTAGDDATLARLTDGRCGTP